MIVRCSMDSWISWINVIYQLAVHIAFSEDSLAIDNDTRTPDNNTRASSLVIISHH